MQDDEMTKGPAKKAPRAKAVCEPAEPPPGPLVRMTLTLDMPWGEAPLTLEVIGVAYDAFGCTVPRGAGGRLSAQVEDLPELRQAGWIETDHPLVKLFTRTIAQVQAPHDPDDD